MTSSNTKTWNTKHVLLNNLESKHILLMKFGQFMSSCKIENFIKKFYKNCVLNTSSGSFVFAKSEAQPVLENDFFEASFLYLICISKTIKICSNQNTDPSDSF